MGSVLLLRNIGVLLGGVGAFDRLVGGRLGRVESFIRVRLGEIVRLEGLVREGRLVRVDEVGLGVSGRIGVVRVRVVVGDLLGDGPVDLVLVRVVDGGRAVLVVQVVVRVVDRGPFLGAIGSGRGVGRPDKALELGRSIDRTTLSPGAQVSLAIAMSGARLDLGQAELALMELEIPQLDPDRAFSYSPDLFAAYSLVLEEVGRSEEAAEWQRRADIAAQAVFAAEGGGDDETIEVIEEEHESADAASAPDRAEEGTAVDDADDYLDDEDGTTAV
ncbi:hypothetical protein, partial [Rathayibacter sp. AY1E1]|uniref:hypothetical protein n=1 Tax=Rathayibacter sp. AY1E1 TaxID=2080549 RepID=UPI0015E28E92